MTFKTGDKVTTCVTSFTTEELRRNELMEHPKGECKLSCITVHVVELELYGTVHIKYDPKTWVNDEIWFCPSPDDRRNGAGWYAKHFRLAIETPVIKEVKSYNRLLLL